MKVGQDKVVTIRYTLQVEGEVLDQGELSYLHGHRNLIPGLEEALEGREEGEAFQAHVPAEKAYGATGHPGIIPPHATLDFQVEVVKVREATPEELLHGHAHPSGHHHHHH
uniref:Peptidyl-prolyl cis-trans isomerase SlyD, Peptidyl-prolyl cis-trans isomerase FKBP1A chimera n=1 Tax=Homo sapiens TaxID=9606 RepID=UPI00058401B8|nr:Chain A, Peptidyl-prolyl cis-trans isomerase SlyD, Peptidyl-prolyl cis-trans isomerase FKBP1A chimera [Thermus thermophilus]4ODQ_A Chain A, Peptidyl-prolyl cis-trans isomerase SlyD, Peptidyl-prolyl cis-trans isomerase FKBP1A chimera [Thermus thermophilus]4ODR_A Chain A, Peptidyl-prolyl cis-trans isomerase SlyD, Peptidyl-prolyl cis-trans isomerase FKBP1A chimera [Thermus thermophilus]4ODR_B Chain B, Peptidyl-prolyl cis-trans isomerase SlyD, Peptidyl-prolyl cis-trans isomerase FKBP1A chimera [T